MEMKQWEIDKRWSDKFILEIKKILGERFIGESSKEEDQMRNTDLIVLKLEPLRFACRIRKYAYFEKYPDDITIRTNRPSGAETELAKILSGWGDFFFYGFSNFDETMLHKWKIIDLKKFRLWFSRELVKQKGIMPGIKKTNSDGSSNFIAINCSNAIEIIHYE
jgi:hypothetical protein